MRRASLLRGLALALLLRASFAFERVHVRFADGVARRLEVHLLLGVDGRADLSLAELEERRRCGER